MKANLYWYIIKQTTLTHMERSKFSNSLRKLITPIKIYWLGWYLTLLTDWSDFIWAGSPLKEIIEDFRCLNLQIQIEGRSMSYTICQNIELLCFNCLGRISLHNGNINSEFRSCYLNSVDFFLGTYCNNVWASPWHVIGKNHTLIKIKNISKHLRFI